MPARIKHNFIGKKKKAFSRRKKRNNSSKKRVVGARRYFPIIVFTVFILVVGFVLGGRKYWNGVDRLSVVIRKDDGVRISTFDPESEELVNIDIPGNTEVEVARDFGVMRLENVWRLSENEGLYGKLVVETITKSFKFPVYIWAEKNALGFSDENHSLLGAVFKFYKTNMSLGDRIGLFFFSVKLRNADKINMNLAETGYLKKASLIDGSDGYKISGNLSSRLLSTFADREFSELQYKIIIKDVTDDPFLAKSLGEVLEMMGGKVVSIIKEKGSDVGCVVAGKDREIIKKITRLYTCDEEASLEGDVDLEITIGRGFAKMF